MAETPPGMLRSNRPRVELFDDDEMLYRRVAPADWNPRRINRAAMALPDMSVIRSQYGHPEWARLEKSEHALWAVVGFRVGDVPKTIQHAGMEFWSFLVKHIPLDENYPHSEVWAFRDDQHVQAKQSIPKEMELRWRDQLCQNCRTIIPANEPREIRQESPSPDK